MTGHVLPFPTLAVTFSADFERGLRNLCREMRKSQAFADELVVRMTPLVELLKDFAVGMSITPADADEFAKAVAINQANNDLKLRLLRERVAAEVATLKALGYA